MYKNRNIKRSTPSSSVPKPVFVSQKRNELEKPDKENNDVEIPSSQDILPSSQHEAPALLTQSRFLSQRHQVSVSRATQEQQIRGKNYFEISLISCKINVTDLGKLED